MLGIRFPKVTFSVVTAVLVVVAILALVATKWWARLFRSSYEPFLKDETGDLSEEDRNRIKSWCASGKKISVIADKKYGGYPYLAKKYTEEQMWEACKAGQEAYIRLAQSTPSWVAGACTPNKSCTDEAIRVTYPCQNKDNTKCCLMKNKDGTYLNPNNLSQNCVLKNAGGTNAGSIGNEEINQIRWTAEKCVSKGYLKDRGTKDNGVTWACPNGWLDTAINNETTGLDQNQRQNYQCAKTLPCKIAALGARKL